MTQLGQNQQQEAELLSRTLDCIPRTYLDGPSNDNLNVSIQQSEGRMSTRSENVTVMQMIQGYSQERDNLSRSLNAAAAEKEKLTKELDSLNAEIGGAEKRLKEEATLLLRLQELMRVKDNKMILYARGNDADLCMIMANVQGHSLDEQRVEAGSIVEQELLENAGKENPCLPQLKIGQSTICGAVEICQFMAETGNRPEMAGITAVEKSSIELWSRWVDENLVMPEDAEERKNNKVPLNVAINNKLKKVDERLETNSWLNGGDCGTVADVKLTLAVLDLEDKVPDIMKYEHVLDHMTTVFDIQEVTARIGKPQVVEFHQSQKDDSGSDRDSDSDISDDAASVKSVVQVNQRANTMMQLNKKVPTTSEIENNASKYDDPLNVEAVAINLAKSRRQTEKLKKQLGQQIVSIKFVDKAHTTARIIYSNGEAYEGKVDTQGERHGRGMLFAPNGDVQICDWSNNAVLKGFTGAANSSTFRGNCLQGKPHGRSRINYPEGIQYKQYNGDMNRGQFHGLGRLITPNNSMFEGSFRDGQKEGLCTFTRPNGTYDIDIYKQGNPQVRVKGAGTHNERWALKLTQYL